MFESLYIVLGKVGVHEDWQVLRHIRCKL